MHNPSPDTLESIDFVIADKIEGFTEQLFHPASQSKYGVVSIPVPAIDPLLYLKGNWNNSDFHYYWEKPADGFAIAAGEEMSRISAAGKDRFREMNREIKEVKQTVSEASFCDHPCSGLMFLGGFSFFDSISDDAWKSFRPASFTIPKWMIIKDNDTHFVTLSFDLSSFSSPEGLYHYLLGKIEAIKHFIAAVPADKVEKEEISSDEKHWGNYRNLEYDQWISSVKEAKKKISQNRFQKIVLARRVSRAAGNGSPLNVIEKLRKQYANCYNFLIHPSPECTFLGSTPERLASFRSNSLHTEALAGSIRRGETSAEDAMFERYLTDSSKEQHEHDIVVKDIEQRLKPFVDHFDMNRQPEIKKFANVQHLYTPIRANLESNVDILSVVEQLHPTPAVGGFPRENAISNIQKLESFERGWYAGPVGWLNSANMGEFGVAIRSGLLTESAAHFYAGCGIVADSDPDTEWEETNLKLQPMLSAF